MKNDASLKQSKIIRVRLDSYMTFCIRGIVRKALDFSNCVKRKHQIIRALEIDNFTS